MQVCTRCGNPVEEGAEYCSSCGSTAAVTEAPSFWLPSPWFFLAGLILTLGVAALIIAMRR